MTELAPNLSSTVASSRSFRWAVAVAAAGTAAPTVIAAIIALASYYPVGSYLPSLQFMGLIGAALGMLAAALLVVLCGIAIAITRWSWRPLALAAIAVGAMAAGFVPGLWTFVQAKHYAYSLVEERSAPLIEAIESYQRGENTPPKALSDLVPRYILSIPDTGMAAYPRYEYARGAGPCPTNNAWHLVVDAGEVLQWDFFFYCPKKNYVKRGAGGSIEIIGSWAYLHE